MIGCPRRLVTPETWEMLTAADLWEQGVMPVAGGWMDQPQACIDGVRMVQAERAMWMEKRLDRLKRERQRKHG